MAATRVGAEAEAEAGAGAEARSAGERVGSADEEKAKGQMHKQEHKLAAHHSWASVSTASTYEQ